MRNTQKNLRPFTAICDCNFGRKVIYTNASAITQNNILDELNKALSVHRQNAIEIAYLERYYKGDQPILYATKKVRPDIDNKVVENHAFELVESKTAEIVGEPVQYVLRGTDEAKSEAIKQLNDFMIAEDKEAHDISLVRWRCIAGTAYRYVPSENTFSIGMDETPFAIRTENPMNTFVVYFSYSDLPAFSCQIRQNEKGEDVYHIYTNAEVFQVYKQRVKKLGPNGNQMIPVIEYPNNERRLSDIELTISITDGLNKIQSNRINGIEQFVQALMKFKNCEIDKNTFLDMVGLGAIVVKDAGSGVKSDVEMLTAELNQTQTQVAKDDLYQNFLLIQGKAGRQEGAGSDTGQAVVLRNGYYEAEKRAELSEPIFKRSERMFLRVVLNQLRIRSVLNLKLSDIEIKITRSKTDNMLIKAEVLKLLLDSGIEYGRAIKTVNMWSDPEEVTIESRDRMQILYPTEVAEPVVPDNNQPQAQTQSPVGGEF